MKKILVVLAVVFTTNAFCVTNNIDDPHMYTTTCGTHHEFDDTGMTFEETIRLVDMYEWLECEGGNELMEKFFDGPVF